ncbi:unnamed protein product [Phytophthora fragariaefolia]|uniref:Unnamed protein product n=1 Tax=Phytophthora fragariaefolia TaxID=1490495 RepID=A0A9W7CXD0_9STRA|nr:unnamed protein product [Phytophthora fragariaefolia]
MALQPAPTYKYALGWLHQSHDALRDGKLEKFSGCIEENIPESTNAGSVQPFSDSLIRAVIDTPQADALDADDCNDDTPVPKGVSEIKFEKDTPTTIGATTRLLSKNRKRPKCVFTKPVKNKKLPIRALNRIERAQRKSGLRKLAKLCKGNEARPLYSLQTLTLSCQANSRTIR